MEDLPRFTVLDDYDSRVVGPPCCRKVSPICTLGLVLYSDRIRFELVPSLLNQFCVGNESVEDLNVLDWKIPGVSRTGVAISGDEDFGCVHSFGLGWRYLQRLARCQSQKKRKN